MIHVTIEMGLHTHFSKLQSFYHEIVHSVAILF